MVARGAVGRGALVSLLACFAACAPDARPSAAWEALLSAGPCGPEALRFIRRWRPRPEAVRSPPGPGPVERFRIPTLALGVWIEVERAAGRPPSLLRARAEDLVRITFSEGCTAVEEASPGPATTSGGTVPAFGDEELRAALLQASREGLRGVVVYVWSPHMVLSVGGYAEIHEACARAGLRMEPVLFPDGDTDFASEEAARVGLPPEALRRSASVELLFRDALVHAPTIVLFAGGSVQPVLPGYRDAEGYLRYFREVLDP